MLTLCSFSMQFAMQKDKENLSLHHMGNYLLFNLLRYNLKPEGLHFFKVFRNLKIFGTDFRFSHNSWFIV